MRKVPYIPGKQTVEFRAPDGSADLYHLMAGIIVAAQYGLQMPNALEMAEKLYVNVNIFADEYKDKLEQLQHLPTSCSASADVLAHYRSYFEQDGIFPPRTIDRFIRMLKSYNDAHLSEELFGQDEKIGQLVQKYLHVM